MRDKVRRSTNLVILLVLITVVVFYSYNRTRDIIFGPQIEVSYPHNGSVLTSDLIKVRGHVKNSSHLFLNDRKIFTDEDGSFEEELLLHYGYNIIEISALDRVGKTKDKILQVVYQ